MPDINLLSTNSQHSSYANTGAGLAVKILGVLLVLVLLYWGYLAYAVSQAHKDLATMTAKTAQVQSDAMNRKERNELITRQGQLQSLDGLIKNHMSWSYMLPELARVTLRSSSYTTISVDTAGLLTMTVNAPNYSDLDEYLQVFNLPQFNQQFSDVKVLSINKTQEGSNLETQMRLQLKFNPDFIRNRTQ